jgi:hypothetical protein
MTGPSSKPDRCVIVKMDGAVSRREQSANYRTSKSFLRCAQFTYITAGVGTARRMSQIERAAETAFGRDVGRRMQVCAP